MAKRTTSKELPLDIVAGQVWRDADGQHYYVESVFKELATLQRCTPAGRVLNPAGRLLLPALRRGFGASLKKFAAVCEST